MPERSGIDTIGSSAGDFANLALVMDTLRATHGAKLLGITRERVREIAQRDPTFPQPVETEPHRRWDRADGEAWADARWWDTRPWRHRDADQGLGR